MRATTVVVLATAKTLLPEPLYARAQRPYRRAADAVQIRRLAGKVAKAPRGTTWLAEADLAELNPLYPARRGYRYDPDALRERGESRCAELLNMVGSADRDFLELGAHDAMAGAALCVSGGRATAIDLSDERDARAINAGVAFTAADACALPLDDQSFDVVYSYNTFEHIAEPDRALNEALRVLRPGGIVYLAFAPLYCSAFGLHAYYQVAVPYCQFLWPIDVIDAEVKAQGGRPLDYVNGWPIEKYRTLWQTSDAEIIDYTEFRDLSGLEIIERFPACFTKAPSFESLLVGGIHIRLAKH